MLSIVSALVVISTAFVGISIYAQTDDSELTTFEEEALKDEEETTSTASSDDSNDATTSDTAMDEETTLAEVTSLFDGLVACSLGVVEVNAPQNDTEIAAVDGTAASPPTVSVTVMSETEVAEAASNETETASADETEIASAECIRYGGEETTTSSNATGDDTTNATSSADNATSTAADNATSTASNNTTSNVPESDADILVIEGQDFAPGEVVLVFSNNALVAIDDVDEAGDIESKVPVTDVDLELRFVESGTIRTANFLFDGETLIAAEGVGDIQAVDTGDNE